MKKIEFNLKRANVAAAKDSFLYSFMREKFIISIGYSPFMPIYDDSFFLLIHLPKPFSAPVLLCALHLLLIFYNELVVSDQVLLL